MDAIVITLVVFINATLGFLQERRAERSLEALRQMLGLTARVCRDSQLKVVPARTLVPGDLVRWKLAIASRPTGAELEAGPDGQPGAWPWPAISPLRPIRSSVRVRVMDSYRGAACRAVTLDAGCDV